MRGSKNIMLAMYQWVIPWPMDRLVRMKAPLRGRRTFSSVEGAVVNQLLRQHGRPNSRTVRRLSQPDVRRSPIHGPGRLQSAPKSSRMA